MRYCTNCGNPFNGNEKFCTKCGTPAEMPNIAISPAAKPKHSHKLRNIIIACFAVLALCAGGVFAASYAINEVFVSSDRVLQKMAAAVGETTSFSHDSSIRFDADLIDDGDRENLNCSISIDGDVSVENKIMYSDINVRSNEDSERLKLYCEFDNNSINLYAYEYDDWEKATVKLDSVKSSDGDDYSWLTKGVIQTKNIDKTEIDGTKVFVIDMGIDISSLKSNIEKKFAETWDSLIEDYADYLDVRVGEVSALFENIPAVDMKIYIDRKTDLPIKLELDAKNSLNSFISNIIDLAGEYGEDNIVFKTKNSNLVIEFKNYNNSDVSIPREAYDGYDNGIINE